jgi:hypothetical protein
MSDWYDTGFGTSADVAAQSLETSLGTLALRSFNGLNTGGQSVGVFSSDPATGSTTSNLYFKVKAVFEGSVTYAGVSFFNGGEERLFFGKPFGQDGFGLDNSDVGGSALIGATGIVDGVEYTIVGKIDIAATEISMWLNPNLAIDEVSNVPIVTSDPIIDLTYNAIRLASGGGGNVRWDDLVLSFTWDDLDYAGADIDGDTLRDTWELLYATNLSVLTTNVDFDADGLLNEEELDALSDPTKADTDGDGLSDFDEVNTGGVTTNGVTNIYVSLPYDTDGDDDGLSDFFEVTLGSNNLYITDPLDADTDDDGYDDAVEVAAGTDPTDPDDNPGGIIVNGKKDSLYGDPISVQLVQTGFGDNQSELNAAYAIVTNGTLCLMLTGNLEAKSPEGNTLEIFIDSTDAVTTNVLDAVGGDDDEANNMDGLTFDSDFTPDYHIWFFQDAGKGLSMWMSDLATSNTVTYTNLFGGPNEGSADTGTGAVNASPISVGFDNSNTAGVSGGSGAADTNAAIAVTTGLEMCIALSDIGNPTGTVKIAAMVDGENMNYLANQMLGSLTPPQGNLGGDGGGGFTGTLSDIDLTLFAGDQFFSVDIPGVVVVGPYGITSIQLISGGTQAEISLDGLTTGVGYIIQDSADLTGGFSDVGGSGFTATGPTETVTVPASGSEQFFQGATTP